MGSSVQSLQVLWENLNSYILVSVFARTLCKTIGCIIRLNKAIHNYTGFTLKNLVQHQQPPLFPSVFKRPPFKAFKNARYNPSKVNLNLFSRQSKRGRDGGDAHIEFGQVDLVNFLETAQYLFIGLSRILFVNQRN